jgi:sestrin
MATTLNDMDLYDEDEDGQFLDTEDDTLRYFKPLMSKEQQERSSFLESTVKAFTHWSTSRDARAQHLLSFHLPTVLRLALTCPFNDVRKTFESLLRTLQDGGLVVPRPLFDGPSSFISKSEIPGYGGTKPVNDQLQILYETAFLRDTRLSHMLLTLGDHPRYLDLFIQTLDFIMYGDGPLSLDVRAYIAILAASRHKCSYLVSCIH